MKAPKLGTWRWGKFRKQMLVRDLYRCRYAYPGCTEVATQVDHYYPRGWGGAVYDEGNCYSVCHHCHREKERRLRNGEALGFLEGEASEMRLVSAPSPLISGDYSRHEADDGDTSA